MKKSFLILAIMSILTVCDLQFISAQTMQRVEYTYVDGDEDVWDFSGLETIEGQEMAFHWYADTLLAEISAFGISVCSFCNDSIYIKRKETPLTYIDYELPMCIGTGKMTIGDSVVSTYKGRGKYCRKYEVATTGWCVSRLENLGLLILQKDDTIPDAVCQHRTSNSFFTIRQTEDSLAEAQQYMEVNDVREWFVVGCRVPLYRSMTTDCYTEGKQTAHHEVAYRLDYGTLPKQKTDSAMVAPQKYITDFDVYTIGQRLFINVDVLDDVDIQVMLCDVRGVPYRRATYPLKKGDNVCLELNCQGMRKGVYMVYVSANGCMDSKKVTL